MEKLVLSGVCLREAHQAVANNMAESAFRSSDKCSYQEVQLSCASRNHSLQRAYLKSFDDC